MHISRFRVENFSSFKDSGWIDLDPAFNLFVGTNNSGKSALLRSLYNPLPDNPHKSTAAFRGSDLRAPTVSLDVSIRVRELHERFRALGKRPTFPAGGGENATSAIVADLISQPDNVLTLEIHKKVGSDPAPRKGSTLAEFRSPDRQMCLYFTENDGSFTAESNGGKFDNLSELVSGESPSSIFYFDAQRLNVGSSGLSSPDRLLPNASNLPAVLAHLQGTRRPVFDRIEEHVTSILSGIERITVAPRTTGSFEILVWPDRSSRFEELAFSLNDSGTGVGQLLSVVVAAVTSEQSIIVVDEINSFLHPTAVKRLLALLRTEYGHHQYIISTHSADTIASCNAEKIFIVSRDRFDSSVKAVDIKDAEQARGVSSALGFSMMDVFGYDRVIWVEGPTEEAAFPYLARHSGIELDPSIGFSSVASTGAFEKKRGESRSAIEIYEMAGKRLSPLLQGMAFALDRERLSDDEVQKAEKSKRKLRYLPRRCFECYLIDPEAILAVLSDLDSSVPTLERIHVALSKGGDQKYGAPNQWNGQLDNSAWLKSVDAARLLGDAFAEVTENRVEFRKTRDSVALLGWLLSNRPGPLEELVAFVSKIVDVALRDTPP